MTLSTEAIIGFYTVSVGWCTLALQLFVFPFFKKGESLFKDYISEGAVDTARSFIESARIIPTLAGIIERIHDARSDKRRHLDDNEIEQLLQEVDYISDLKELQDATKELNTVDVLFEDLRRLAGWTWKIGLLHVALVFVVPNTYWLPKRYDSIFMAITGILALFVLMLGVIGIFIYHNKMTKFLRVLGRNR